MTETLTRSRATIDDVLATDGKAELINGRIVEFPMPGYRPYEIALAIALCLREWAKRTGLGHGASDGLDFAVEELASGRESFRPDASYFTQTPAEDPDGAIPGAPAFAVEVRSKSDYGHAAEK